MVSSTGVETKLWGLGFPELGKGEGTSDPWESSFSSLLGGVGGVTRGQSVRATSWVSRSMLRTKSSQSPVQSKPTVKSL